MFANLHECAREKNMIKIQDDSLSKLFIKLRFKNILWIRTIEKRIENILWIRSIRKRIENILINASLFLICGKCKGKRVIKYLVKIFCLCVLFWKTISWLMTELCFPSKVTCKKNSKNDQFNVYYPYRKIKFIRFKILIFFLSIRVQRIQLSKLV